MEYKVEKNVPIPKIGSGNGGIGELALALMSLEIGDSILLSDKSKMKGVNNASQTARRYTGFRFTNRKAEGGQRVWRIE